MELFINFKQSCITLHSTIRGTLPNFQYTGDLGCLVDDACGCLSDVESLTHWSRTRDQRLIRQSLTHHQSCLDTE
jgi:hypothetical protein